MTATVWALIGLAAAAVFVGCLFMLDDDSYGGGPPQLL